MHIFDLPAEVFNSILNFLDSCDLLHCAMVCKRWTSLAVDVKWKKREVDFISLMAMLGPLECLHDTDDMAWQYQLTDRPTIQEALASDGWLYLNRIRRKVTHLLIPECIGAGDLAYFIDLKDANEQSPDAAFCPSLRHLIVETGNLPTESPFHLFAGERLRYLEIRVNDNTYQMTVDEGLMPLFAEKSPYLEHILIWAPTLLNGLHAFGSLRELDCRWPIPVSSAINVLHECPRLESLYLQELQRSMEDQTPSIPNQSITPSLPNLKHLTINLGRDQEGTVSLELLEALRTTEMPALEEIDVGLITSSRDRWRVLLNSLSKRAPHLAVVSVVADSDDVDWGLLGHFQELRDVVIYGEYGTLTSEAIWRIVKNNPGIQRLEVNRNYIWRAVPDVKLPFLERIAARCKHLRFLSIQVDAITERVDLRFPTTQFDSLTILCLDLLIPATAVPQVATYLAQLCPHIEQLIGYIQHSLDETDAVQRAKENGSWRLLEDIFFSTLRMNVA